MKGFISYAHRDLKWTTRLHAHIAAIERAFGIDFWMDHRINAGTTWNQEIADAIDQAQVFVLVISPDFIRSEYIYTTELPAISAKRQSGSVVFPVALHRCYWELVAGPIQALPTIGGTLKPVSDWHEEMGLDRVRQQMQEALASRFRVTPFNWST